jgi:hypothetical protein
MSVCGGGGGGGARFASFCYIYAPYMSHVHVTYMSHVHVTYMSHTAREVCFIFAHVSRDELSCLLNDLKKGEKEKN